MYEKRSTLKSHRLTALLVGTAATFTPLGGVLHLLQHASAAQAAVVQQQNLLTGTVTDEKGEPIIGATVRVAGTKTAVITDLDGVFKINAKTGDRITVTYIGYITQTVTAKGGQMKITLKEEASSIGEVEVVAYGTQKKVSVTGAISSVSGQELTKAPVASVTNVLAGNISGVSSIQYSGEPGSDNATLYLRGKGTFTDGGATPLIQIDGVTSSMADFALIDPQEIESVSVLKDASATAVFGVEGANGVILVTTKRGKEGKASISFTSTESLVMPTNPIEMVGSYEYASFYDQMLSGDGKPKIFDVDPDGDGVTLLTKFKDGSDPIRFPSINWVDYCMKRATFQSQNNVNITGGTKTVRYFLSAGMLTQGGLFKQFDQQYDNSYQYQRFNYRANLDMDVTSTTAISLNMSGRLDTRHRPKASGGDPGSILKSLYASTPFGSPGLVDGKLIKNNDEEWGGLQYPFSPREGLTSYYGQGNNVSKRNALSVQVSLKQKLNFITKGLTFGLKGAYNSDFASGQQNNASVAIYYPIVVDGETKYRKSSQSSPLSYGDESLTKGRDWYFEANLNWSRSFGDHNLSALLLYNQHKTYYTGGEYDDIPRGLVGMAARLTYDYKSRYLAEFNVGHNGSENFAPGKRFGWFPAGSVGWILSEESFFKPLKKVVNYLKLRASLGLVGKDNVSGNRFYYTADPYSSNSGGYYFGSSPSSKTPGASAGVRHNPDVGWEKALKQNYGLDASFIGERFNVSFDYYKEHRTDILLTNNLAPGILGFAMPVANLGVVNSWGWELAAGWNDKIGKKFRYWVKANMSYNQNEIVDMKEVPQDYAYQAQTGHRIGTRGLYKLWRLYYDGIEADYEKTFGTPFPKVGTQTLQPGDAVYVDINGDGVVDGKDVTRELNAYTDDPEYTIGLNMDFSYKNWNFSMLWSGAWNVSRQLSGTFKIPFYNANDRYGGLLRYVYEHSWTPENPNPNAEYPRATTVVDSNTWGSDLFVKNSSYLRLKTVNLSYDFKFPFMNKIKINQLQLGVSAYNLLTITSYIWGDPEGRATDAPTYPLTRTVALNLKVGF